MTNEKTKLDIFIGFDLARGRDMSSMVALVREDDGSLSPSSTLRLGRRGLPKIPKTFAGERRSCMRRRRSDGPNPRTTVRQPSSFWVPFSPCSLPPSAQRCQSSFAYHS